MAAANPVFGNFDPSLDLVGKPLEKDGEDGKMQLSLYHSVSKLDVSRCMIPNDSFKESQGYFCVIHLMYQWDYDSDKQDPLRETANDSDLR